MVKILFLNAWMGRAPEYLSFMERAFQEYDIIMLTEVDHGGQHSFSLERTTEPLHIYQEQFSDRPTLINHFETLQRISKAHGLWHGRFAEESTNIILCTQTGVLCEQVGHGSAIFYRNGLSMLSRIQKFVWGEYSRRDNGLQPRVLQGLVLEHDGQKYIIAHFHGIWIKNFGKNDTKERIEQSRRTIEVLESVAKHVGTDKIILGGDFNLDKGTDSLQMLEFAFDMRNLVLESGIDNTRTPLYREWDREGHTMFADWLLTTPSVPVKSFSMLEEVVSDHRGLILEI